MSLSRRQFLQGATLFASAALLSPAHRLLASTPAQQLMRGDHLAGFLAAMNEPFAAPLNAHFEAVLQNNNAGLLLYDLSNARFMTALAPENPLPVASAFKAPLLLCFVDTVDEAVWGQVPVDYWFVSSSADVPENYRDSWRQNQAILQSLYRMIVISDNVATGEVLSYLARYHNTNDPLVYFNDWARDRVGMSQLSALSAWDQGLADNHTVIDTRFTGRGTTIAGQVVTFENLMTPRDIGLFYVWMLSDLPDQALMTCQSLLSTIRDNRGANLERLAIDLEGVPYSKNGSLITDNGTVITDAGVISLSDDRQYLLVMLSLGMPTMIPTLFEELNATLRGRYNEILHHHRNNSVSREELLAIYTAHLQVAYPHQEDMLESQYQYGFIVPEGVDVYANPNDAQPIHNPIIRSTRFGIHLLMQGALVRYVDVDANWVELMPDDHRDNVRVRLGNRLFVRRSDVWRVSLDYSQPILSVNDTVIDPTDKFIAINLGDRELMAFEGATPILRIPIVLNPDTTPRGAQVITSKWFARSMQPWAPGVPFTSFFGSEGYALHGSPWQRWSTTVNQGNISGRSSAGCINVPDWMITAGNYHRPADELLFRWVGGMENVGERIFDYPSDNNPALRIFNVDYLPNLRTYYRPEGLTRNGSSWDDVIDMWHGVPLQAPESFFV